MHDLVPAVLDILNVLPFRVDVPKILEELEKRTGPLRDDVRLLFEKIEEKPLPGDDPFLQPHSYRSVGRGS